MKIKTKRKLMILLSTFLILLSVVFIVFFPSEYNALSYANIALNGANIYANVRYMTMDEENKNE